MEALPTRGARLREVAWVFLKLGTIGFGGPAAHVAMMRREVVAERGWVDQQEFLDGFAATSMLPGPGSTQLAIYLARRRAGWPGLLVGGVCFIAPAFAIVLGLGWLYVRYGTTVAGRGMLYGIAPVVVAIVADAVINLGKTAVRGWLTFVVGAGALAGYLAGINVILLLAAGGAAVLAVGSVSRTGTLAVIPLIASARAPRLPHLFLEFLKLGSVVFGSGYVLFAYLRRDLVSGLGWLGSKQLLDAIAVGQVTPGPVFTTATFIGYLVHGFGGAVLATLGIFLPSFALLAALGGVIPRLRRSSVASAALDGINAAAVGIIAGVVWDLGRAAVSDLLTGATAAIAFLVLVRARVNYGWLVLAGGIIGLIHAWST